MRGPKHVVKKGKTSALDGDEAKRLLDSIDVSTLVGLRDRALIALRVYTFARVSRRCDMNVEDYYPQGNLVGPLARERRQAKRNAGAPSPRNYIDAYVTAAGIGADKASPLFRTLGGRGRKERPLRMARQGAADDGAARARGRGSSRALGVTPSARPASPSFLNGGLLEYAQQMAAHESAPTTKLTIGATIRSRSIRSN